MLVTRRRVLCFQIMPPEQKKGKDKDKDKQKAE